MLANVCELFSSSELCEEVDVSSLYYSESDEKGNVCEKCKGAFVLHLLLLLQLASAAVSIKAPSFRLGLPVSVQ